MDAPEVVPVLQPVSYVSLLLTAATGAGLVLAYNYLMKEKLQGAPRRSCIHPRTPQSPSSSGEYGFPHVCLTRPFSLDTLGTALRSWAGFEGCDTTRGSSRRAEAGRAPAHGLEA